MHTATRLHRQYAQIGLHASRPMAKRFSLFSQGREWITVGRGDVREGTQEPFGKRSDSVAA
jgi:hypothetical protein